ncbi:hypothetical protein MEBOL_005000 [Melittangium boletus DSM 14713]|uniref:Uncharacterized protein n=2 Tax=Melittangium boletus TaxID=83453 RepID=A0A250IK58_9BACT|nr:hypothetical protein MEBOL_005000 [Melittangium boletus DSM 14713]
MGVGDRAVQHAREWLQSVEPGSRIHDVQEDPRFQHRGVDLLWELPSGEVRGIEVKGDRQPRRKRYFFELVSNLERDTPGCFLYSGADLMLYVFLVQGELHVLPLKTVREWFLPRAKAYELRHTFTQTGAIRYTTVGAVVPVKDVQEAVAEVKVIRLRRRGESAEEPASEAAPSPGTASAPEPPEEDVPY